MTTCWTKWKPSWLVFLLASACTFEGPTGLGPSDPGDGDGDGDGDLGDGDGDDIGDDDTPETSAVGRLVVPRAPVAPTTSEYVASEWEGIERMPVTMVDAEHKHIILGGYTEDVTAEIAAVHDDGAIYLLVELGDDEAFEGDGIEIYIDAANDRDGQFGADDYTAFIPTNGQWSGTSSFGLDGSIAPAGDADYIYVMRIDKASMTGVGGPELGFNIALYDDDDGSGTAGWGLWHEPEGPHCQDCCSGEPHSEPWCDTSMLGTMILGD